MVNPYDNWWTGRVFRLTVYGPVDQLDELSVCGMAYPPLLREIPDPPVVLYAQGDYLLILNRNNREEAFDVYATVVMAILC